MGMKAMKILAMTRMERMCEKLGDAKRSCSGCCEHEEPAMTGTQWCEGVRNLVISIFSAHLRKSVFRANSNAQISRQNLPNIIKI